MIELLLVLFVGEWIETSLHVLLLFLHQPVVLILDLLDAAHAVARNPFLSLLVKNHPTTLLFGWKTLLYSESLPLSERLWLGNGLLTWKDDPLISFIVLTGQVHFPLGFIVL